MPLDSHTAGCLETLRSESTALSADLQPMSDEVWNAVSNCSPWRVRDLATHVVASGEGFVDAIRAGLRGSVEPDVPPDVRAARQAWQQSASPVEVADALEALTERFVGLYDGLTDAQLDATCFHRRGNRSVRWYAAHRLAEVAFHGWDLRTSLGRRPTFDDGVAALLLPTLLESNAPRTYAAGLSAERGRGERFRLVSLTEPPASRLMTVRAERLEADRGGAAPADVTIAGAAGALALLVYGRLDIHSAALSVEGDPAIAERFAVIFPRP